MNTSITTTVDGTFARIFACGEIDFDTLPRLRAAVAALSPRVTDLQWDLTGTSFMDIAGLHLLFHPTTSSPERRTTVTGLGRQPLRLLLTACETGPAVFDFSRLLPNIGPAGFRPAPL
ncbi:STAS domain-containing protein [Streptomyces sp. NPDC094143]|uniref:STAS domain-containing protein n=1 Tax=Streptomyces sp. NPDC094143 TaxID=3155310 RepID=UPI00332C45C2